MKYKKRLIEEKIKEKLEYMGGVSITGPKWCGKTETAKIFQKTFIDLSDEFYNNNVFINEGQYSKIYENKPHPIVIDEWQTYPYIWNSIKNSIDKNKVKGEFILTGSATPVNNSALHPGTGRISVVQMKTMTLYESLDGDGSVSLKDILNNTAKLDNSKPRLTLEKVANLISRGGWPNMFDAKKYALEIAKEYVNTLCDTDISKYDGENKDPILARAILKAYARNIHTVNSTKTIIEDVNSIYGSVSDATIYNYINAFKRLFILEDVPGWNPNIRSKTSLIKGSKKSFIDPSLAVAALETSPSELLNDAFTFGLLFENLVYRDLSVYTYLNNGYVRHYRDRYGLECDFVLHFENGKYGLVEVKLGDSALESALSNLRKLKGLIKENKDLKEPSFLLVITGSNTCVKTEDGIYIVPIDCLRN